MSGDIWFNFAKFVISTMHCPRSIKSCLSKTANTRLMCRMPLLDLSRSTVHTEGDNSLGDSRPGYPVEQLRQDTQAVHICSFQTPNDAAVIQCRILQQSLYIIIEILAVILYISCFIYRIRTVQILSTTLF